VFVANREKLLLWLGVLAGLAVGDVLHLRPVTVALVAPFLVMRVLVARRDRRDVRAIAESDWTSLSPHAIRVLMALVREPGSVRVDDAGVSRTRRDGRVDEIRWDDVQSVAVVVLPRRLHSVDVTVSLQGKPGSGHGILMPYDEAPLDFLVHLQTLPGLDADELGEVLQAQPIGTTEFWQRKVLAKRADSSW
jgi:hypothetical protein